MTLTLMQLPLTTGHVALIDQEDAERVNPHRWRWLGGYAVRCTPGPLVYLHRLVMDAPKGIRVDHINGNKLDNRRCNLRLATASQNSANYDRSNASGYRGVYRKGRIWFAQISVHGKDFYLGSYPTPEAAALAYNEAAYQRFGEYARLNQIESGPYCQLGLNLTIEDEPWPILTNTRISWHEIENMRRQAEIRAAMQPSADYSGHPENDWTIPW